MKKVIALVTAALIAGAVVATAVPAGADVVESSITVHVTKSLVNPLQQDATFIVKLTCSDSDDVESSSETLQWHAPGNSPWHLDPEDGEFDLTVTDYWDGDVTCVLSEPTNGGATSTTITCVDDANATCDGASLYIDEEDLNLGTYGEFEVVNDFTAAVVPVTPVVADAAPASVVVVSPRFTG